MAWFTSSPRDVESCRRHAGRNAARSTGIHRGPGSSATAILRSRGTAASRRPQIRLTRTGRPAYPFDAGNVLQAAPGPCANSFDVVGFCLRRPRDPIPGVEPSVDPAGDRPRGTVFDDGAGGADDGHSYQLVGLGHRVRYPRKVVARAATREGHPRSILKCVLPKPLTGTKIRRSPHGARVGSFARKRQ